MKMAQLPLPRWLPLLGQQGQSQRLRINPPHISREWLSFCFPAPTWFLLSIRKPEGLKPIRMDAPCPLCPLKEPS